MRKDEEEREKETEREWNELEQLRGKNGNSEKKEEEKGGDKEWEIEKSR